MRKSKHSTSLLFSSRGLANYSLRPNPAHHLLIGKDLLEHCHTQSLSIVWLLSCYNGRAEWLCCCCLASKSCLILLRPCSSQGYSVHGTSQARILEWVAISFSRRSFQSRDWAHLLNWQADSLPMTHEGGPEKTVTLCKKKKSLLTCFITQIISIYK